MQAAVSGREWWTRAVTTGKPLEKKDAAKLLLKIAESTWNCGDPGLQYNSTIQKWHTCKGTEPIHSTNPCSEYVFLNNTACNLASLNLMKFKGEDGTFDVDRFKAAVRLFITAQEILVDNSSYPIREIAENSHIFRTLGLGYANLGLLSRYNYAGFYEEQVCGLGDAEQMTALDAIWVDDYMPNPVSAIPGNFVLSALQVITNQTQIVQPFTQDPIPQLNSLLPALTGSYAIGALLIEWTPTNLPVPFPQVTEANIQTLPFAKAFISIRTNYVEKYREAIDLFQATGDRISLGTNGPALSSVDPSEMHPLGGTWRDYLWLNWSNGINYEPYLGLQIRDGQSANSDRYDASGNWNPNNFGAWKSTTCSALQEQYEATPTDNRSDADIQLADPIFYNNTFVQRTIQFNYQTLGWTKTNAPAPPEPAPVFDEPPRRGRRHQTAARSPARGTRH